jgi:hypothetical protein
VDPEKRIEELEAQLLELQCHVRRLEGEGEPPAASAIMSPEVGGKGGERSTHIDLVGGMRKRLDHALHGDSQEDIEVHIGAVWLSRLAAVVTMTFVALAAQLTFGNEILGPLEKVLIGYTLSLVFFAYGFYIRKEQAAFAQVVIGCALAMLHFTTYAVFFVPEIRLLDIPLLGLSATLVVLAVLVIVAHFMKSQTVAGIGLFLVYYSIVVTCARETSVLDYSYAVATCIALALTVFGFHCIHQWSFLSGSALVATYFTYFFFFRKPHDASVGEFTFFWASNGLLTICYLLFAMTSILDVRRYREHTRGIVLRTLVNSGAYFFLIWLSIRGVYSEQLWLFGVGFTLILGGLTACAALTGKSGHYLTQVFLAKVFVMLAMTLQTRLSGAEFLVALAVECVVLAGCFRMLGWVLLKELGLLMMTATFVGSLLMVKVSGEVSMGEWTMQANWFVAISVTACFSLLAWMYERIEQSARREHLASMEDSLDLGAILNIPSPLLSIAHSAAGAIIILTITIIEFGSALSLPYLIAVEGVVMAVIGILLCTPQIEIACVLLLVAAHVCFHIFLWLPVLGFEEQESYTVNTLAMALFTYVGAHAWERYLQRFVRRDADWEHHIVAALPYLIATLMLGTLIARGLDPVYVPVGLGTLGMTLFLVGSITRFSGVKASGILATLLGTVCFYRRLYAADMPLTEDPDFIVYFVLFLGTFVGTERLIRLLQSMEPSPLKIEDGLRTILVGLLVVLGMLGLYYWSPVDLLFFYLLAHATVTFVVGLICREGRYRWGALCVLAIALIHAFTHFRDLAPLMQVLTFGAAAVVLWAVSRVYTRLRRKENK